MRARRPDFDFSDTTAHWAKIPEFAHFLNSASVSFPYLERFLNRTMAKVATTLSGDDARTIKLKKDIQIFIRQEANHYSLHERFNAIMPRSGYDISAIEAYIESEYERLWNTKSFAFCVAYCEGFETLGPPFAHIMLDMADDLFAGADPEVVALWKWHLMEEFEHRTVCYDAFAAVHGGYFLRIYAFFYQMRHLGKMSAMARKLMIEQDRAGMTPAEVEESKKRAKQVGKSLRGGIFRIFRALSPWYSPHPIPEPKRFRSFMAEIESRVS